MMTAKDIREKRFEKAAWGYRPEDIDEFLGQLEATFQEIDNEREDSNHKIQVLADKVREYMKDEEALKDALLGAQKQGHRVINEANEKAEQILNKAKEEAAVLLDEATRQHEIAMEKNRAEIAKEKEALVEARQMVADFKRSLFDMYKSHLEMISSLPEADEDEEETVGETAPAEPETPEEPEETAADEAAEEPAEEPAEETEKPDPFATSQFSSRVIQGAYDDRFGELQFGENNNQTAAEEAEAEERKEYCDYGTGLQEQLEYAENGFPHAGQPSQARAGSAREVGEDPSVRSDDGEEQGQEVLHVP